MNKWMTCNSFSKIRELIEEEIKTPTQCMKIMYALESCCDELTQNKKEYWIFYDAFRDLKSEIHDEVELMDEYDYESCKDTTNCYLDEMYDLCDAARVWLA